MADNRIRRLITLILDRTSAQKAEKDTQDSLKKGTDPTVANRNLARFGAFVKDVGRLVAQAAAAVGGYVLAVAKLTERGGEVLGVQKAFTTAVGDTDTAIAKLREATRGLISDYDLMVGFNRALTLGAVQNIDDFAEMSDVALQLGRALGVDAASAMESLSLGIGRGSKLILDNLGIIVDGAITIESVMAAARKRVDELGGAAETSADSLKRWQTQLKNLKDEVAVFLANSTALRIAFEETADVVETIVLALQSGDRDTMVQAFKVAGGIAGHAFVGTMFSTISLAAQKLWETFGLLVLPMQGLAVLTERAADDAWNNVNALIAQGDQLKRQIENRRYLEKLLFAGGEKEKARAEAAGVTVEAEEARLKLLLRAQELGILQGDEWKEIVKLYLAAGRALKDGNTSLEDRIRLTERLLATSEGLVPPRLNPQAQLQGQAIRTWDLKPIEKTAPTDESVGTKFLLDNLEEVKSASQVAALGMQNAFEQAFLTIGEKSQVLEELEAERIRRMAEATTQAQRDKVDQWYAIERENAEALNGLWETLARGFAASILSGLAQIASAKVAENIAKSVENLADGLAAAANPLTAAMAPGYFAAAKMHGVAAAKWGILGGVAGAASSAAGGGGASSFRGSDVVGRRVDQIDRTGPDIVINVDGIDPKNPRHQMVLHRTIQGAQERYGQRITVRGR